MKDNVCSYCHWSFEIVVVPAVFSLVADLAQYTSSQTSLHSGWNTSKHLLTVTFSHEVFSPSTQTSVGTRLHSSRLVCLGTWSQLVTGWLLHASSASILHFSTGCLTHSVLGSSTSTGAHTSLLTSKHSS